MTNKVTVTKISGGVKFAGKFLGKPYERAYTEQKAEEMKTRFLRAQNNGNTI